MRLLGDFRQGGTVALEVLYCGGRQGVPIIQWYRMDPGGNAMFFLPPNPLPRDPPHSTAPTPAINTRRPRTLGLRALPHPPFWRHIAPPWAPGLVVRHWGPGRGLHHRRPVHARPLGRRPRGDVQRPQSQPRGKCAFVPYTTFSGFRNDSDSPPTIVPSHLEMQRLRSICHRNLSVLSFIISPQGVFIFFDDTATCFLPQDGIFSLCLWCY